MVLEGGGGTGRCLSCGGKWSTLISAVESVKPLLGEAPSGFLDWYWEFGETLAILGWISRLSF